MIIFFVFFQNLRFTMAIRLQLALVGSMMTVVHHRLKTYDLKANLDQPLILLVDFFTTFVVDQIPNK